MFFWGSHSNPSNTHGVSEIKTDTAHPKSPTSSKKYQTRFSKLHSKQGRCAKWTCTPTTLRHQNLSNCVGSREMILNTRESAQKDNGHTASQIINMCWNLDKNIDKPLETDGGGGQNENGHPASPILKIYSSLNKKHLSPLKTVVVFKMKAGPPSPSPKSSKSIENRTRSMNIHWRLAGCPRWK